MVSHASVRAISSASGASCGVTSPPGSCSQGRVPSNPSAPWIDPKVKRENVLPVRASSSVSMGPDRPPVDSVPSECVVAMVSHAAPPVAAS